MGGGRGSGGAGAEAGQGRGRAVGVDGGRGMQGAASGRDSAHLLLPQYALLLIITSLSLVPASFLIPAPCCTTCCSPDNEIADPRILQVCFSVFIYLLDIPDFKLPAQICSSLDVSPQTPPLCIAAATQAGLRLQVLCCLNPVCPPTCVMLRWHRQQACRMQLNCSAA